MISNDILDIAEKLILKEGIIFEDDKDLHPYMATSKGRAKLHNALEDILSKSIIGSAFTNIETEDYIYFLYDDNFLSEKNIEVEEIISKRYSLDMSEIGTGYYKKKE